MERLHHSISVLQSPGVNVMELEGKRTLGFQNHSAQQVQCSLSSK